MTVLDLSPLVVPKDGDVSISRYPEGPIKLGIPITFTCTVSRIKPPANYIRWEFTHEAPRFGQNKTILNVDNYTFSQTTDITYTYVYHLTSNNFHLDFVVWVKSNVKFT